MSPLKLEEEVNTALNSGQTYRQVDTTPFCALGKANLGICNQPPATFAGSSKAKRTSRRRFEVYFLIT